VEENCEKIEKIIKKTAEETVSREGNQGNKDGLMENVRK
jgi:hypothetical protein